VKLAVTFWLPPGTEPSASTMLLPKFNDLLHCILYLPSSVMAELDMDRVAVVPTLPERGVKLTPQPPLDQLPPALAAVGMPSTASIAIKAAQIISLMLRL